METQHTPSPHTSQLTKAAASEPYDATLDSTQFEFLRYSPRGLSYLPANYYRQLLKPYLFPEGDDLTVLRNFLGKNCSKDRVLEIGCGDGRATTEIVAARPAALSLLDASNDLLKHCAQRFGAGVSHCIAADALTSLRTCQTSYQEIVALWSLSHSIHRALHTEGIAQGSLSVAQGLDGLLTHALAPQGRMLLIHFDATSPEQQLICACKALKYPAYRGFDPGRGEQSYSLQFLREALARNSTQVELTRFERVVGVPTLYANEQEALEAFLNFHLEGEFNQDQRLLPQVLSILQAGFEQHRQPDGTISIGVGAFIIEVKRAAEGHTLTHQPKFPGMSLAPEVRFCEPTQDWGPLCNFSEHMIQCDDRSWASAEHCYQAQKFRHIPALYEQIATAPSAAKAKELARECHTSIRVDWEQARVAVMLCIARAKFEQHADVQDTLRATTGMRIVEANYDDAFWGVGPAGLGLNLMGKVWEQIRAG